MERKTIFSPCRKYRYTLWRDWYLHDGAEAQDWKPPFVQFIGLNPSTADETQGDPTVRRCIGFAKAWGYGAMCMTNLFAWRDTDPKMMKAVGNPVGADNFYHIHRTAKNAGIIVAAWGNDGSHMDMSKRLRACLETFGIKLHCLGTTASGQPKHPLYLAKNIVPKPYEATAFLKEVETSRQMD